MIYNILLLTFGIFIGQNYPLLPNIKILFAQSIVYLQTFQGQQQPQEKKWYQFW